MRDAIDAAAEWFVLIVATLAAGLLIGKIIWQCWKGGAA